MTDQDLTLLLDHAIDTLNTVSILARRAKEENLTRLSSDLFHGANRAWHELVTVRQRHTE